MKSLACLCMTLTLTAGSVCALERKSPGEEHGSAISGLIGNWTRESLCVNKERFPACNDEQVVYHVAAAPGKTDTVSIAADRIVNGKPVAMGTFEFAYDGRKQTLTSEFRNERVHILFELAVKGDLLEGTLSALPERTVVRRIKVKKAQ